MTDSEDAAGECERPQPTYLHQPAMLKLGEAYVLEVSAQVNLLREFTQHHGEVGRAHELLFSHLVRRFLPTSLQVGTGFIAERDGVSLQQDVLIYRSDKIAPLFQAGELVVVDAKAAAGSVEVKTTLRARALASAFLGHSRMRFYGIFAWDSAISMGALLDSIWDWARKASTSEFDNLGSAIYVRGRFLLLRNQDGSGIESPPFRLLRLDLPGSSEGEAVLGFLGQFWLWSTNGEAHAPWPPWLWDWFALGPWKRALEPIHWPDDLADKMHSRHEEIVKRRDERRDKRAP